MISALPKFTVEAAVEGEAIVFDVSANVATATRRYRMAPSTSDAFDDFFVQLAKDFGVRPLQHAQAPPPEGPAPPWRPLLTGNIHPRILSGYGDPAVLRDGDGWWLVATSNDAPDAFPILFSPDLESWEPRGFVFGEGTAPTWTVTGTGVGDFWAPEIARVGREYWLSYTARDRDHTLAIGLAKAEHPAGPWTDLGRPLLTGSVIDSHIHVDEEGTAWLIWKEDRNSRWPSRLAALLHGKPQLLCDMFDSDADRRAAAFCAAVEPFAGGRKPMERFFLMQPLIHAAIANWSRIKEVLACMIDGSDVLEQMATPVLAQPLSADGHSLTGKRHVLLTNDLEWEGHLVEGPFITRQNGRFFLFYAGNDFTSPSYGIGYAVADRLTGPYCKAAEPLLQSHTDWVAPGHASVSVGADGAPRLFFHAYHPGTGGYNVFRALLTVGLRFDGDQVVLVP